MKDRPRPFAYLNVDRADETFTTGWLRIPGRQGHFWKKQILIAIDVFSSVDPIEADKMEKDFVGIAVRRDLDTKQVTGNVIWPRKDDGDAAQGMEKEDSRNDRGNMDRDERGARDRDRGSGDDARERRNWRTDDRGGRR